MPRYSMEANYYLTNHLGEINANSYEEAREIAERRAGLMHDEIIKDLQFDNPEIKVLEIEDEL